MNKNIDEFLKEKYDQIEVPDDMFNLDEILKQEPEKKRKFNPAASFFAIILVMVLGVVIAFNINLVNDEESIVDKAEDGENQYNEEEITLPEYVTEISIQNLRFDLVTSDIASISIVEIEEILDYSTFYFDDGSNISYPITKVRATVLNNLVNEVDNEIEFWIPGGVWTISELKESNLNYDETLIQGYLDEDYIKVNYSESIVIDDISLKNIYITALVNINNELYVGINEKYGFKQYNQEDNTYNRDGEWIEVDVSYYEN